ncbi:hypothetical protein ACFOZ9_03570 [Deinococcus navajonensis]|uniref:Uncharacterized protein n=1 Tax=Deinococcus navajonensis TaxID=309884 RepID=A0ABV8XN89_9DEIO
MQQLAFALRQQLLRVGHRPTIVIVTVVMPRSSPKNAAECSA